jgi:hypothetical protein
MAISKRGGVIDVTSIVSSRTKEGIVQFKWNAEDGQLTPDEARAHALGIIEAAEAAETDAFLVEFLTTKLKTTFETAIVILRDFRAFREARQKDKQQ